MSQATGSILQTFALGSPPWPTLDPFLFCVHHVDAFPAGDDRMGPAVSTSGRQIGQDFANIDGWNMYHGSVVPGFPSHPHRGFETITFVRRGLVDHSDSLGATARFGEGDAQWLTAGRGIVHAEMFPLVEREADNPLELFQIWLNLPAADKMVEPYFTMLWADDIPTVVTTDDEGRRASIEVVAGSIAGQSPPPPPPDSWAARTESDVAVLGIHIEEGSRIDLPAAGVGVNRVLYLHGEGSALIDGELITPPTGVVLEAAAHTRIEAASDIDALVLQGRPIGEPVAQYGPFVMNDRDGIEQAFADYQQTQFGGWPWPAGDPVHDRDQPRFARHADGRVETIDD
ncbi:MAG: pirin family protein [Acidimicrobiales bacterium]